MNIVCDYLNENGKQKLCFYQEHCINNVIKLVSKQDIGFGFTYFSTKKIALNLKKMCILFQKKNAILCLFLKNVFSAKRFLMFYSK